jgi:hypothetical protein
MNFTGYIRPICLANPIEPDYVNTNVVVTGWGKTTTNSNLSPVLRKATVPVISNNECRATYGGIVTNKIMCTSGYSYTGTCKVYDTFNSFLYVSFHLFYLYKCIRVMVEGR